MQAYEYWKPGTDDSPLGLYFSSIVDAEQYVTIALGDFADDYDVSAIASAVTDHDERGRLYMNIDSDRDFWDVVRRHCLVEGC